MHHLLTPKEAKETLLELREGILRLRPALIAFSAARPVSERGQQLQERLFACMTGALCSIDLLQREDYAIRPDSPPPPVTPPPPPLGGGAARRPPKNTTTGLRMELTSRPEPGAGPLVGLTGASARTRAVIRGAGTFSGGTGGTMPESICGGGGVERGIATNRGKWQ